MDVDDVVLLAVCTAIDVSMWNNNYNRFTACHNDERNLWRGELER